MNERVRVIDVAHAGECSVSGCIGQHDRVVEVDLGQWRFRLCPRHAEWLLVELRETDRQLFANGKAMRS